MSSPDWWLRWLSLCANLMIWSVTLPFIPSGPLSWSLKRSLWFPHVREITRYFRSLDNLTWWSPVPSIFLRMTWFHSIVYIPRFHYPLSTDGYLGWCHDLGIMNSVTVNTVNRFLICILTSLLLDTQECYSGRSIFSNLRNFRTDFWSGWVKCMGIISLWLLF